MTKKTNTNDNKTSKRILYIVACVLVCIAIGIIIHLAKSQPFDPNTAAIEEDGTNTRMYKPYGISAKTNQELIDAGYLTNDGHLIFKLNDKKMTFPLTYKELIAAGFTSKEDVSDITIEPGKHIDFLYMKPTSGDGEFAIDCYNNTKKTINIKDSLVSGLSVYLDESTPLKFSALDGKLKLGGSQDDANDLFQNSDYALDHVTPQGEFMISGLYPSDTRKCEQIYMTLYRRELDSVSTETYSVEDELNNSTESAK